MLWKQVLVILPLHGLKENPSQYMWEITIGNPHMGANKKLRGVSIVKIGAIF